jgi:hypothetical protein
VKPPRLLTMGLDFRLKPACVGTFSLCELTCYFLAREEARYAVGFLRSVSSLMGPWLKRNSVAISDGLPDGTWRQASLLCTDPRGALRRTRTRKRDAVPSDGGTADRFEVYCDRSRCRASHGIA